ncbi:MAG: RNA polymerase sigma factor [Pseudomonadota bacterium]
MTQSSRLAQAPRSAALFDELLVTLIQQGDTRAMERLHKRWNARLARAALRYTGDPEMARDLAQECWIGLWKGIKRLRDPAQFRSYAFAILHKRGADHLRGAIRERAQFAAPLTDGLPAEQAGPASQSDHVALQQAFASLPPNQRLAAHLHFVEGLTLREIAAVQDIAEGTAKSRLFHARRKLKAALSEQSTEPTEGEPV